MHFQGFIFDSTIFDSRGRVQLWNILKGCDQKHKNIFVNSKETDVPFKVTCLSSFNKITYRFNCISVDYTAIYV